MSWNGANETTAPSAGIGSSPASARGNSASSSGSSMRFTSCTPALASERAASRRSAAAALPPAASYRRTIRSSEPSSASLTQSNTMVPVTSVSETSGAKSGNSPITGLLSRAASSSTAFISASATRDHAKECAPWSVRGSGYSGADSSDNRTMVPRPVPCAVSAWMGLTSEP